MSSSKLNTGASSVSKGETFGPLFGRFRVMVLNKISRGTDTKKSNDILKSVFSKLYDTVNKKKDNRPGLNLIEFKISVHKLLPGFSLEEIRQLFVYFDMDGSGRISSDEFVIGIKV
jgi:Ca2+-binding EF-hand superfamily protein